MALPPAGRRFYFFSMLGQKVDFLILFAKTQKIYRNKKNTNSEKSVHGTGFWDKRQTGNVLENAGIVIRTFLTDVRPMKVHFTEK